MGTKGTTKRRKRKIQVPPELWYPAFIATLEQTGNVKLACSNAKISRQTAYRHRAGNDDFATSWELAMEDAGDGLEAEARRRAVVGVESKRLLLYKGEPVIDWTKPGKWVDDNGAEWKDGVSRGRKRWTGAYLYEVQVKYSDTLLLALLKGAKPDVYADRVKIDADKVNKEAQRLADSLGVPVETLLAEARNMAAEGE